MSSNNPGGRPGLSLPTVGRKISKAKLDQAETILGGMEFLGRADELDQEQERLRQEHARLAHPFVAAKDLLTGGSDRRQLEVDIDSHLSTVKISSSDLKKAAAEAAARAKRPSVDSSSTGLTLPSFADPNAYYWDGVSAYSGRSSGESFQSGMTGHSYGGASAGNSVPGGPNSTHHGGSFPSSGTRPIASPNHASSPASLASSTSFHTSLTGSIGSHNSASVVQPSSVQTQVHSQPGLVATIPPPTTPSRNYRYGAKLANFTADPNKAAFTTKIAGLNYTVTVYTNAKNEMAFRAGDNMWYQVFLAV